MATLMPDRRSHQVLRIVAASKASRGEIMALMADTPREARKVKYIIAALQTSGAIKSNFVNGYHITDLGLRTLADLDAGATVQLGEREAEAVPNARVFGRG